MSGRTEVEAVQRFQERVQRIISCITNDVASVGGGYYASTDPHVLTLGSGAPARLGGAGGFYFSLVQRYRIVHGITRSQNWQVVIVGYFYTFFDAAAREVLAYHWHPDQRSYATWPHLHLEAGAEVGRADVANAHLVSGWVSLADVVHMAITELNVSPRRDDWQAVLDDVRTADTRLRSL